MTNVRVTNVFQVTGIYLLVAQVQWYDDHNTRNERCMKVYLERNMHKLDWPRLYLSSLLIRKSRYD